MRAKSINKAFILVLLLSLVAPFFILSTEAISIDSSITIQVGNANYTVDHEMTFSQIDIAYPLFNTTTFNITSANPITVTLHYLHPTLTTATIGDSVLYFYANTTAGNVLFTITGFKATSYYTIYVDGTLSTNILSNGAGAISFTVSSWSQHSFNFVRGEYYSPAPPEGTGSFDRFEMGPMLKTAILAVFGVFIIAFTLGLVSIKGEVDPSMILVVILMCVCFVILYFVL